MANMMVQFQVKDFAAWKKVFDDNSQMRTSSGEISHQVYHDANDPSSVTTLFKWDSQEKAQKFSQSTQLREAQMQSGVLGMPTVHFLDEA
jgi:heme-degrading monooxygenase HmoA